MTVGDYVCVIHGRHRWKSGRIIAQPAGPANYGPGTRARTVERKWVVELIRGPRIEIHEYELEIVSPFD